MNKQQQITGAVCATLFSLGLMSTAHAALIGRLPATPGGTDYQAYYDDVLDVTWLADANYAQTSGYGVYGLMTWDQSMTWVGTLNTANHLGFNDWRLPTMIDTGTSGCNYSTTGGTDCGYNVQTGSAATTVYSEMASLWTDTLGNLPYYGTSGNPAQAGWGLTNTGPFSNLQSFGYWSGVEYAPSTSDAWFFNTSSGLQNFNFKGDSLYGWAVRSGDVSAVPVPAAVWLFGSGLIGLLGVAKRKAVLAHPARHGGRSF